LSPGRAAEGSQLLVTLKAGEEIALHVNPRHFTLSLFAPADTGKVCTVTKTPQQSATLGPSFEIWIYCDIWCFKVATKGHHWFDCTYGVPSLQQVDMLKIGGDVTLTQAPV
uniref:Galectin n=1 Tax=Buteo japonicus TaxID=224669 RepID=A0A8C0HLX9_9AVES